MQNTKKKCFNYERTLASKFVWKIFCMNFFEEIAENWQKAKRGNFLQDEPLDESGYYVFDSSVWIVLKIGAKTQLFTAH